MSRHFLEVGVEEPVLNLPVSLFVVDNAPYHNVKVNKIPVQQWLQKHKIPFADMLEAILHVLIKQYNPHHTRWIICWKVVET
jgi:hypothetical protein